jgi:hypothetical protein
MKTTSIQFDTVSKAEAMVQTLAQNNIIAEVILVMDDYGRYSYEVVTTINCSTLTTEI